jgi:predicted ATPase/DNA-binding CsgD family transcriptional regulator/transcriptional regulator with XRE-family HTH domain/predicted negative regulator of RcsB-dependent stress response
VAAENDLAGLLRRFRLAAGLSQEALAERAGLSVRGISDLERGLRRIPHPATLARLAEALELTATDRATLLAVRQAVAAPEPPPEVQPPIRTMLGRELSSFVGRQRELDSVASMLAESPLVTLAGPGGAGKTRLAMRIARAAELQVDSVCVVELAPVGDPTLVPRVVGAAIGVAEHAQTPLLQVLTDALSAARALLVLDNCEHLVGACAELVDTLLRACPELRVLATSREPLGVEGEAVFRVPPLGLPEQTNLEACAESEAVQLFVQRAAAARSGFALDDNNAASIARVCQRLAGLPLAIELAAARIAGLSVDEVAAQLDSSIGLLSGGYRLAPPRQRTLEAAIAWSHDLLPEDERHLFDELSVFACSFHLEQAQAVHQNPAATLELLTSLVNRSMVQLEPTAAGSARFHMLEPLRQFGRQRLVDDGAVEDVHRRHAWSMVELVERVGIELDGPDQIAWFQRIDAEWDNVRAATDWAQAAGEVEIALRLAAPLWLYWSRPDRRAEGQARMAQLLALPGTEQFRAPRAYVLATYANLTALQADVPVATRLTQEALGLARELGDALLEATLLRVEGQILLFTGKVDAAAEPLQRAAALAHTADLVQTEALIGLDLAVLAAAREDHAAAEDAIRSSLALAHSAQRPWCEAMVLNILGDLLRARGDIDGAADAYERALPMLAAANSGRPIQGMFRNLAQLELARGDTLAAARLFIESAEAYGPAGGDRRGFAECIVGLAACALQLRQPELAARLFGSAVATLERLGSTVTPTSVADYERTRDALAVALDAGRLGQLDAEGRLLRLEQALELARGLLLSASLDSVGSGAAGPAAELTARELEVAGLLASGFRNRQIAEALVITEKTAANHVQRVLDKLGVTSRAQVAARAAELGLSR